MENVLVQAALSRAEALALRDMLDGRLAAIQQLETGGDRTILEEVAPEKNAVIRLIMAVESALRAGPLQ
jgi:hypothetical protein